MTRHATGTSTQRGVDPAVEVSLTLIHTKENKGWETSVRTYRSQGGRHTRVS